MSSAPRRKSAPKRSSRTVKKTRSKRAQPRKKTATRSRAVAQQRRPLLGERQSRDAGGLVLIALGCYLACVLLFGWEGGVVGVTVRRLAELFAGRIAFVTPFLALFIGALLLVRSELVDLRPFRAGLYILVPALLLTFASTHFGFGHGIEHSVSFAQADVVHRGGWLGAALYFGSYSLFGDTGTTIVCLLGLVIGVLFITGSSVQAVTRWWAMRLGHAAVSATQTSQRIAGIINDASAREGAANVVYDGGGNFDIFGDVPRQFARAVGDDGETHDGSAATEQSAEAPVSRGSTASRKTGTYMHDAIDGEQLELLADPHAESSPGFGADARDGDAPGFGDDDHHHADSGDSEDVGDHGTDDSANKPASEAPAQHVLRARVLDRYKLPEPSLLTRSRRRTDAAAPGDVERIKRLLVETFGHFGIEAKCVGMVPGPRVSRYELSLAPGTKMSKVENLRKDLAYALATTEIRILAPIPGKSAVGIEVENERPSVVKLGDIWAAPPKDASPLWVWFGKDISGEVVGADLTKMPHLLVAGTTGSGKSGCMNVMLSSLLLGASPDEVKMLLIDPKKVELSSYEGIPHLLTPVVTNMKKASNALGNVIAQMEDRYASMELLNARTLAEYNAARIERGDDPVPYILVVIDELADLVMTNKSDVEDAVIRVAQKGRAAGFHLVLATQRPSVDVITGMIKSNIPSRVAFAVSSQTDSRVIIDHNGAETLLGSGDMLFKPVWARSAHRVQGAWIGEKEVRALCEATRKQREPDYDVDLLREPEPASDLDGGPGGVDEDERIVEAAKLVAEFQTCSASFFQRRMRVGYTRGARLVDMLERRGFVAPGEGPRPRQVLITADDLPRVVASLEGREQPVEAS